MIFDEGVFDEELIEDFLQHYSLDAIIEEINKPAAYDLDAILGNVVPVSYYIDARLINPEASTRYLLDAVLVLGRNDSRLQESIINAIIWSWGREVEKLSESISLMGLRLTLQNAVSDDLDLYWARILGLKRRYNEPAENFRVRLATRLAIMKSSGTRPECESILNHILGMNNAARLDSYWPAEVRLCWNSYTAMRRAESMYASIEEAMDSMIAAGVSWSTAFPYIEYLVDVNIGGKKPIQYLLDAGIAKEKSALYLMMTDIFMRNTATEDLDAYLETAHTISSLIDAIIRANPSKLQELDACLETTHSITYLHDVYAVARLTKTEDLDALIEKECNNYYNLDGIAERARKSSYLLTADVQEAEA